MTDISGVPAFGGGGFAQRQPPDQPRPAVPEPAKTASDGSATFNKGSDLPGQNGLKFQLGYRKTTGEGPAPAAETPTRQARNSDSASERRGTVDLDQKNLLTGPTPAFQASVLEVERDLRHVIAQVEAKRTQKADEAAIAPAPTPETGTKHGAKDGESEQPARDASARSAHQSKPEHAAAPDATAVGNGDDGPDDNGPDTAPSIQTAQAPQADREAAYAGSAAVQPTPYDGTDGAQ